jgi:hypothetical protein
MGSISNPSNNAMPIRDRKFWVSVSLAGGVFLAGLLFIGLHHSGEPTWAKWSVIAPALVLTWAIGTWTAIGYQMIWDHSHLQANNPTQAATKQQPRAVPGPSSYSPQERQRVIGVLDQFTDILTTDMRKADSAAAVAETDALDHSDKPDQVLQEIDKASQQVGDIQYRIQRTIADNGAFKAELTATVSGGEEPAKNVMHDLLDAREVVDAVKTVSDETIRQKAINPSTARLNHDRDAYRRWAEASQQKVEAERTRLRNMRD